MDLDATSNCSDSYQTEPEKSKLDTMPDDVMIGLGQIEVTSETKTAESPLKQKIAKTTKSTKAAAAAVIDNVLIVPELGPSTANENRALKSLISIDDLLCDSAETFSAPSLVLPTLTTSTMSTNFGSISKSDEPKTSRTRGLDELDLLGENALRAHLPQKSPQFSKKNDKLPMNQLQKKKSEFPKFETGNSARPEVIEKPEAVVTSSSVKATNNVSEAVTTPPTSQVFQKEVPVGAVRIADLHVPLASIKPGIFTSKLPCLLGLFYILPRGQFHKH